jgi:hypothetical protein
MSSTANHFRILLALSLFGAVVFAPWWAALALALTLAARFRAWEVVAAGVLYDFLWLPELSLSSPWTLPLGTIISLIFIIGLEPLRRRLLVGPAIL